MSKEKGLFSIFVAAFVLLALIAACGGGEEPTPPPSSPSTPPQLASGAELLKARCTRCHTLDRVMAASKTQAEWEATVARMRGKGAEVTDEEAQILIEYLAETYGP
ncbi:MAG: hypothetical protein GTO63_21615 [Anaerolineae bacterium]|nr:hypothetical protein [Anaerolineae bacterium]NIN97387.1 hypothetical protein [Anaerolineae bacterium]NIQ80316.1 hypothetical protein [Anaerolineae bacterium]